MGREGGSRASAGLSTMPAFGASLIPAVSRASAGLPVGKHTRNTGNHAGGGLGEGSGEAGINLEMDEGKDALLCLAPGCSGTNELPTLENPGFCGLMARACTVLIKWNRLFSLRDTDIIKAS